MKLLRLLAAAALAAAACAALGGEPYTKRNPYDSTSVVITGGAISGVTVSASGITDTGLTASTLVNNNGSKLLGSYAGTSCTNQAITALSIAGVATCSSITSAYLSGTTGSGTNIVLDTSPTFATSAISPLWRSTAAKVLLQGTGTGATQVATTQTTAPTCSSNCGTSPTVAGTDTAMIVTMGSTGVPASGWVVTFNGTWAAAPACMVQSALATMVVGKMAIAVVTTTTTITVTTNGTAPATSDKYQIHCLGVQ